MKNRTILHPRIHPNNNTVPQTKIETSPSNSNNGHPAVIATATNRAVDRPLLLPNTGTTPNKVNKIHTHHVVLEVVLPCQDSSQPAVVRTPVLLHHHRQLEGQVRRNIILVLEPRGLCYLIVVTRDSIEVWDMEDSNNNIKEIICRL